MGGQISLQSKIGENELLRRFSGLEPITDNDPFWNQLLSYNLKLPGTRGELREFEDSLTDYLEALMYNSATTGNFAAFVRVFLRRATELKTSAQCDDKIFLWQTQNALIILRYTARFLCERLSETEFLKTFCKNILTTDGNLETFSDNDEAFESPSEEVINALVEIMVDLGVNDLTRALHSETVLCLLALLSTQLHQDKPNGSSKLLLYLMQGKSAIHAPLLTKTLLRNLLNEDVVPPAPSAFDSSGSLVIGLASTMMNVLSWTLGGGDEDDEGGGGGGGEGGDGKTSSSSTTSNSSSYRDHPNEPVVQASLADLSLQLLLVLTSHNSQPTPPPLQTQTTATSDHNQSLFTNHTNPYREALSAFQNAQEVSSLASPTQAVATFKLDYGALYEKECRTVSSEPSMLLLYLLLHRNSGFRNYVLSRINLEELLLPVLKVLHKGGSEEGRSHHVYLALIVILILSEDEFFAKIVHETKLKSIDWYSDRPMSEVSLGGLIILVLCRTIQHNIVKVRDRYLHTNCLAALANMSAFFKDLSATVAQRLVGLLEILTKRHSKLVEHLRVSAQYDLNQAQGNNASHQQDITALEEGIRTLLEIVNSCLTHSLRHNPHLIYTMLYKQSLFESYHQHPMFQDLIWNISAVLNHFANRVSVLEKGATVSQVLVVIEKSALQWPNDRLKKFPDLKFKYVEDDNTEEFFVPYVWTLVYRGSGMFWEPSRIKLFNALTVGRQNK